MTVKALIEQLREPDENLPVFVSNERWLPSEARIAEQST